MQALLKAALFNCHSPQAIIHQLMLMTYHNQQYINYYYKKTVCYCCYFCLCDGAMSFPHEVIVHKPAFIPPSSYKSSDTDTYVHSWLPKDGDGN